MPFLQIIITFGNAAAAHVEESVFIKFSSPPSGLSPTWLGGLSQSPAWCLMCLLLQFQILLKIPFFSNQIMFMFFYVLSSPKHPREWVKCKYFEECWNKLNLEGSINSAELGHVKVSSVFAFSRQERISCISYLLQFYSGPNCVKVRSTEECSVVFLDTSVVFSGVGVVRIHTKPLRHFL